MRRVLYFLSVALVWMAAATPAGADPSVWLKPREGSLVIPGENQRTSSRDPKDTLYTLLVREVKVYLYRGHTPRLPPPYPLGQTWQRPAGPYIESLIQKYSLRYGVDPSLVRAVIRQESGFNPNAVSPKGAQGLMQLMPGTAALMGVTNPFDPEQNIAGGVGYLRHCLESFNHNVPLAVAAYNAGPARVARSQGVPPIRETQNFVRNVMGTYAGGAAVPLAEARFPDTSRPRAAPRPFLGNRIIAPPSKAPAFAAENAPARPRPKIIEVRYPGGRQVLVARPGGD